MRQSERRREILNRLSQEPFASVQELQALVGASEATVRRDLKQLADDGALKRVHGGVERPETSASHLAGAPLARNKQINVAQKRAIARAAAGLVESGDTIVIDGGSTTAMLCPFLADLDLQVLTNSLPIVEQLLLAPRTRLLVPGGEIFREQNIILSPFEDDGTAECFASKMLMGAQALAPAGLLQADSILIRAERRLMARAEKLIVLADSSKFDRRTGLVLCTLSEIDVVVTDSGIGAKDRAMLEKANVEVVIAED
ncbi:MAG: DeoR/GlpR transcriptional regulator [Hyphomonadaceae bacterium]|nr:MAG: DeoR family transcriptional regulator ulaG and ulaABCDEF operon transcriptional repressor [Caulobacteraceae bacterium]MBT9444126.1 DeoR/GlpR transcriptional regulator [Hyphomonadaceae bacterium]TPW07753.1 MAG: DeoR family transcriptional regulator, ulaG and ulaABCDEF operon transcriptional repressor [Alphaproteobacteria bacterium]